MTGYHQVGTFGLFPLDYPGELLGQRIVCHLVFHLGTLTFKYLLTLGFFLGRGCYGCTVLLFPYDAELFLYHRRSIKLGPQQQLLKIILILLGLRVEHLRRLDHLPQRYVVLIEALLEQAFLLLRLLVVTVVPVRVLPEHLQLVGVPLWIELDLPITFLGNAQITSCELLNLHVET